MCVKKSNVPNRQKKIPENDSLGLALSFCLVSMPRLTAHPESLAGTGKEEDLTRPPTITSHSDTYILRQSLGWWCLLPTASRQGQAPSPISCVVWQEPAARELWQTCTLPSGWPHCHALSPPDLEGPHVSRYLHREVVGVLCCGWHLSWMAFLSEGTLPSPGGCSCTPTFNADKTPRPFHFTSPPFGASIQNETSLTFLLQG